MSRRPSSPDEEITPPEPARLDRLAQAEELLRPAPDASVPPAKRESWRALPLQRRISTVVTAVVIGLAAAAHFLLEALKARH